MFKDDPYKVDLINGLEDGNITIYRQGEFADLCRGPHVETVKKCKNFKLLKHSGAYWKVMPTIKCFNVFMVFVSIQKKNWKLT